MPISYASTAFKKGDIFRSPIFHIILIILTAVLAYSNTFEAPFHFDDSIFVSENLAIRHLNSFAGPLGDSQHPFTPRSNRYLGFLTFALNYHAHGLDILGYHIVNFSIHIINALLVYWLVLLTFQTPLFTRPYSSDTTRPVGTAVNPPTPSTDTEHVYMIALFSSLIFVSHPAQTQAVTYISQRFASLATMFYLSSLATYVRSKISRKTYHRYAFYAVSLVCAVLAMKTKEISFTLPMMIALYEFMFFDGKVTRRLLPLIPLMFTMLIIPQNLIGAEKPIGDIIGDVNETMRMQTAMSRWDYLFTQFRVIATYLRLLIVPLNQNLDYDYPIYYSFLTRDVFLSFLLLLLILLLGVYLRYRSRGVESIHGMELSMISFGIFWFFLALSVESSFVPIVDVIFEHRLYLPSVGMIISVVTFVLVFSADRHPRVPYKVTVSALSFVVIALTCITYSRNAVWQSDIRLWQDVVKKSPNKARGYVNLGLAFKNEGMIDEALEMYNRSIALDPMAPYAFINRGIIYHDSRQNERAIEDFTEALVRDPESVESYNNRGTVYSDLEDYERAIADYSKAISLNPSFVPAYVNRGNAYDNSGDPRAAIDEYNRAISINPDYEGAYFNRGITLNTLGRVEARADFQKSCALGNKKGCEMLARFDR